MKVPEKKLPSIVKELEKNEKKLAKEVSKSLHKGAIMASVGVDLAKDGAISAKNGIIKTANNIAKAGKNSQKSVLKYVDQKKNARFLDAKLKAFEDGIKQGKYEAVDYIKKCANFCLAATAISFFFARCDGEISEEEMLEIQFDLDSIIKNKDLPEELRNKLAEISLNEELSFDEVKLYLDGVGVDTLLEFQKDIDEIISADGVIDESEEQAKRMFDEYLESRKMACKNE